jgi:hypothetical protein
MINILVKKFIVLGKKKKRNQLYQNFQFETHGFLSSVDKFKLLMHFGRPI